MKAQLNRVMRGDETLHDTLGLGTKGLELRVDNKLTKAAGMAFGAFRLTSGACRGNGMTRGI